MKRLLVPLTALLLAATSTAAFGWSDPVETLRTELLTRDGALTGELDRAQVKEKKAYQKALKLLDPSMENSDELKVMGKVVKKLKRVWAADEGLAEACRTAIDGIADWIPDSLDSLQAQIDLGHDGSEKDKAQAKLTGLVTLLETSRQNLLKHAKGTRKVWKSVRKVMPLVDAIPAPDGARPLGKSDFKALGIDPNLGGQYLESMFGRWRIENVTTGEEIDVLLCMLSLEHADERRYGAAGNWNLQSGQMYALVGRMLEPWGSFAGIRSPMYGDPLSAFWTHGLDGDENYGWFRWTRLTRAPVITFSSEIEGTDLTYSEGSGDQTVGLDFRIDWSVADPWFANGQCGYMAVSFEFYAETANGYQWVYKDLVHEAKTIPFTTAGGRFEGHAEFTNEFLWTEKPTRVRLLIGYVLEDVCRPLPVVTDSLPLTNGK
jgi:hypothetical protein